MFQTPYSQLHKTLKRPLKDYFAKAFFAHLLTSTKYLPFYIILATAIFSCSSRNTPAPVTTIYSSSVLAERNKGIIKTAQYTVKQGETLYSIAWRAKSDVRNIARLNNLSSPYKIYPGQNLFLKKLTAKKTSKVTRDKAHLKKSNNSSTNTSNKSVKNTLASSKKQAYGENVQRNEIVQKSLPKSNFSKKIKRWQWPVKGKVIEYFSNSAQGNKGIDITGRRGINVKSAAKGKVVYAGSALRGYGKLIIVKHNDDYLSAYAHNDSILVKEQQQINAGDVIAKMGDTETNKVMLHFEIRFRGKSVNPMKYLPAR